MKLKCKRKKIKNMLYILSSGEEVINKSNKLVYCIKKRVKYFQKASVDQWRINLQQGPYRNSTCIPC